MMCKIIGYRANNQNCLQAVAIHAALLYVSIWVSYRYG